MADAKITALTELTSVDQSDLLAIVDDPAGTPITKKITIANATAAKAPIASPTFTGTVTLPKTLEIQDTSADHQYVLAVSELGADRTVTLPLLTGNDEFVFKDHAVTMTNKTLTSPKIGTAITDTSGNEVIITPATGSAVNEITVTNAATTNSPIISATGDDTNIDVKITGKGTGHLQAYSMNDAQYFDVVPNSSMARQAIINGNFDVWQRGTTSTGPTTNTYPTADRWKYQLTVDGGTAPTIVMSRQIITSGAIPNAFYHSRLNVNGAGSSFGANALGRTWAQFIEHGTRYLCGDGKKVTVSFWAKSDIANKKIGVYSIQYYGGGGSPSSIEIINGTNWTLTSTWTKYTHTITTNTLSGKTFGTDNDDNFGLAIATMWGTTTDAYVGADGAESFVGSGNIDIAQVQLCAGDVDLPFMPKSYEEELRACQRYYEKVGAEASGTYFRFMSGMCVGTTELHGVYNFSVQKRNNAYTLETTGTANQYAVWITGSFVACSAVPALSGANESTKATASIKATVASGLTSNNCAILASNNNASAYLAFSNEL